MGAAPVACWNSEDFDAEFSVERPRCSLMTRCWLRMRAGLVDLLVVV